MKRWLGVLCVVTVVCTFHGAVRANLLAHDGFDYYPATGNLIGQDSQGGFAGQWYPAGFNAVNQNNYVVQAGSLQYEGLSTYGNRMYSESLPRIAGIARDLAGAMGGHGTTTYMSFLARAEGLLDAGQWNGYFGVYLDGSSGDMFVGKPGGGVLDEWVIEHRGGASQRRSGVDVKIDETTLLVVKCEFTAGIDIFTLYVNPVGGGPEPQAGTVLNTLNVGTVDKLVVYSTGEFSLDEIRIGETFADVTPVPEPATLILLAIGGVMVRKFR